MRRTSWGFTLYELLMTTALVGIVLAAGLPAFSGTLARQRQAIEINALFHAIHLARKESIVRRKVVSLCPSPDGQSCEPTTDWSAGWIMFENADRDSPPALDPGEIVLRTHRVSDEVRILANRRGFTLRATVLRATNGTFIVCDRSSAHPARDWSSATPGDPGWPSSDLTAGRTSARNKLNQGLCFRPFIGGNVPLVG